MKMKFVHPFLFLLGISICSVICAKPEEEKNDKSNLGVKPKKPDDSVSESAKVTSTSSTEKSSSTSTTALSTSSTENPLPPSSDKPGDWNITENNITCIRVKGFIQLNVSTENKDNKTHEYHIIKVPYNAPVNGSCVDQYIRFCIASPYDSNNLQFTFSEDKNNFVLNRVDGNVTFDPKKKNVIGFGGNVSAFATPLEKSYICKQAEKVKVSDRPKLTVVLELKDFQIQAFKNSTNSDFGSEYECPSDGYSTPDIVPIIVGCALAVLVIVVLVAYLISRRRSQAHGYLSM